VRIIAWKNLAEFAAAHPRAATSLHRWRNAIHGGQWHSMAELSASFAKAKSVSGDRVRFEVDGGNFRLIAAFDFKRQIAFVKFIGTHAEYDRVDAASVGQF
jgi:mRNA interferase HigB